MFADDTKTWTRIISIKVYADLQKDLDSLSIWSANWQLRFNPDKCKVMHVGHQHNSNYMIHQDNTDWNIQEVTEEEDLGVLTTCTLKVSRQCHEAASKANRGLDRASIAYENILRFSQHCLRSTVTGHFQSRENEKMSNSPLVTHYFQANQCVRQDNNSGWGREGSEGR